MKNEQLRKHLKNTFASRWRFFRHQSRLESCGQGVYFDTNVKILRYPENVAIKSYAVIKEGARICSCNQTAKIQIGENTTVGYQTFIFASDNITIGDNCLIAPFVYIVDSDHTIAKGQNINTQTNVTAPISIGDDVWIGAGAKILKGVTIHHGAVIAAGAVVKDDVPENTIFGGVPAKQIGERK